MKEFIEYCLEKKKLLIASLIISIVLILMLYSSSMERQKAFLMKDEQVMGVKSDDFKEGVTLHLVAEQEDVSVERDVTLIKSKAGEMTEKNEIEVDPEISLETEITMMIKGINRESGESEDVLLPESLGDNTTLSWSKNESKGSWILPLLFPPMLMVFLYRGQRDELKKREQDEVSEILRELPSFNNKLVLLLGSGLVYEESIRRVAMGNTDQEGMLLVRKLKGFIDEANRTNGDATKMLNDYAGKKKISELKRITSIIMDNRKKGTDLRSKLALEGELLWEKRKKKSEEIGRIAESKLTLPLGIMMIAILIVTAGPALMQM